MKVGWNARYILHCLGCTEWISKSSKLLILTILLGVLILAFPTPASLVVSSDAAQAPATAEASLQGPVAPQTDPAVGPIETFLKHHGVDQGRLTRVAESIVNSAKKYNVDPRLIASIMLVESRANPFAISDKDSVGIMQIHLPTWGETTEKEGINLLKIEDNVDFGTRILKNYVRQFGLWEGVKRYKGWIPDDPASEQSAGAYLARVQTFYGSEKLGSTKTVSQ
jgi:soluble lytic murein transglycosylase-like protein